MAEAGYNYATIQDLLEGETSAIHAVIERFIVRNFTVAGKTANRFEKNFASVAQSIAQNELKTTDEIMQAINVLIISDEKFCNNLKVFEVKKLTPSVICCIGYAIIPRRNCVSSRTII